MHSFDLTDGAEPFAPVVQARNGAFYGTTFHGGIGSAYGYGSLYRVSSGGVFKDTYDFQFSNGGPTFGLTLASTQRCKSSRKYNAEIHRKYMSEAALVDPRVGPVFAAWDDLTVRLAPVSVIAWDMRQVDQQFFGGAFKNEPTYLLPLERRTIDSAVDQLAKCRHYTH